MSDAPDPGFPAAWRERLRQRAGAALRDRVAGPDAARRAAVIWGTPGERWFAPGDPVWRVHEDAAMFAGGIAALLLQSLHPLAMAGVAQHSGYRGDPWGRLQRTSGYIASTTFGTVEHARRSIDVVRSVHTRVRGTDARGRSYRADDPVLLGWVHTAEAWCFLQAFQAFGPRRLTAPEADTYVQQAGRSAAYLGVPNPPRSVEELERNLTAYRPALEVTDEARDAARFLLLHPPLPVLSRPGYWTLAAGGVAVLPPWARSMLGLTLPAGVERAVLTPVGRAGTAAVRWAMRSTQSARVVAGPVH